MTSPHPPEAPKGSPHHLQPNDILALLDCAYCTELLEAPTTLRCGHTVCSKHVQLSPGSPTRQFVEPTSASSAGTSSSSSARPGSRTGPLRSVSTAPEVSSPNDLPSCPIESCTPHPSESSVLTLPTSSRVAYYPPPPPVTLSASEGEGPPSLSSGSHHPKGGASVLKKTYQKVASAKQDVVLSKILQLTVQAAATSDARRRFNDTHSRRYSPHQAAGKMHSSPDDSGSDDDADTEEDTFIPAGSSSQASTSNLAGPSSIAASSSTSHYPHPDASASLSQCHPGSARAADSRPSHRSVSPPPPSVAGMASSANSRRRRHSPSSPEVSDEQPPNSPGGGTSVPGPSRHKTKKRKMGGADAGTRTGVRAPGDEDDADASDVAFAKALKAEVQCEICFAMLFAPTTTPCEHTFCAKCLSRTLDHGTQCPLCRQSLPGYAYFHDHATNQVLTTIMLRAFPKALADRKETIEEEEKSARLNTPLFICQLAFPGLPTILHIFEPRYRLMVRRCLQEPTPAFGMMMPPRSNGSSNEYGTMLEILSVQMLPDGRSMVETKGIHRFRVMERGQLDGYTVGRIERIDDIDPEFEELLAEVAVAATVSSSSSPRHHVRTNSTPALPNLALLYSSPAATSSTSLPVAPLSDRAKEPTVLELMQVCRDFYDQLRSGTAPWVVQQLNNTYGAMPTDPSTFSFWMAVVGLKLLPIDENEKAKLLPIRSPRLRLKLIVHWIQTLNSSWWFHHGCLVC